MFTLRLFWSIKFEWCWDFELHFFACEVIQVCLKLLQLLFYCFLLALLNCYIVCSFLDNSSLQLFTELNLFIFRSVLTFLVFFFFKIYLDRNGLDGWVCADLHQDFFRIWSFLINNRMHFISLVFFSAYNCLDYFGKVFCLQSFGVWELLDRVSLRNELFLA